MKMNRGGEVTTRGAIDWLLAHEQIESPSAGRKRALASWGLLLFLAVIAAIGYLTAHSIASGRVPLGTTVAGVDIGGLTAADAKAKLSSQLEPALRAPVQFTHGDDHYSIVPADAGVRVDIDETLRAAGAEDSDWSINSIVRYFAGGKAVRPSASIDTAAFGPAMSKLAAQIGKPAIEGTLNFDGGVAHPVYGQPGLAVDPAVAQQLLINGALTRRTTELPLVQKNPSLARSVIDQALEGFGKTAMSAPVVVTVGASQIVVPPGAFGPTIAMVASGGTLTPRVDPGGLSAAIMALLPGTGPQAQDATVKIVNGAPRVVPALAGVAFDPNAVAAAFTQVLSTPGAPRVVDTHAVITMPAVTADVAQSWAITTALGSTTFAAAPTNQPKLDGFVIKPGQTLVLSALLGGPDPSLAAGLAAAAQGIGLPVTAANGDVSVGAPANKGVLIQVTPIGSKELTITLWSSR